LVQDWLQVCDQAHTRCQLKAIATFPARLIEITDWNAGLLRLAKGDACGEKYTTLSYRWGDTASSSYVTNKSNVDARHERFSLNSLPRTIRDAIHVTHLLGLRFIWIDAVCIIQDSHEDWSTEGARMDQIYTRSYLTISADTSPDTKAGFLRKRDMLGWSTCIHPTLLTPWDGATPGGQYGTWPGTTLDNSRLTGIAVPPGPRAICSGVAPAKKLTDTSILGDRGWILQERVLSRRTLHWSEFEISWECNELIASE
ncbi:heterokaryon incompatibility protein-domain-containing protein, partial [Paraphoma chrysanthemicola]